ncbi:MAG: TIGR03915 family putative DNA repair protein [Bacteroidales bacterium]|nr:TIGR03915 family putative DNA repair protein [Bacteroidales bacterium]
MTVFCYDKTFEGLLTCVFDAYLHKLFPDTLVGEGEPLPLFHDELYTCATDTQKADRVWKALGKKLSNDAMRELTIAWMADGYPKVDELLFRFIRKAVDAPKSIEVNFADQDVLALSRVYKQVSYERMRLVQFARFQKTADDIYFAPFEPQHNILPMAIEHFKDRFAGQKWIIYDVRRGYGYYYDLHTVEEITFTAEESEAILKKGFLADNLLAEDELLFQKMWQTYFKSIAIKERRNPRKHRQDMPVRYWKYLTEKRK